MAIKNGQTVKVIAGKDKGKTGKIIQVFPKLDRVVVDGVNKMYKHVKKNGGGQSEKGDRVDYFGPIHISNVKIVVDDSKKEEIKKSTKKAPEQEEKKALKDKK